MAKTLERRNAGRFYPNTLNIPGSAMYPKNMDKAIDALDYALSAMDEYCCINHKQAVH